MMSKWRRLAEEGAWDMIDFYDLTPDQRRELLAMVRAEVPERIFQNGLEQIERHPYPDDVETPREKSAAKVLYEGELEALVNGDPSQASEHWLEMKNEAKSMLRENTGDAAPGQRSEPQKALVWEDVKSELTRVLEAAAAGPEWTVGDAELSQASHSQIEPP
jgi:hypothetical protein